jgi:hypothetical protein
MGDVRPAKLALLISSCLNILSDHMWIVCLLLEKPPSHRPHHTTPFRVLVYKCNSCDGDVGITCRLPFVFFILNYVLWKCRLDKLCHKAPRHPYWATTPKRHYYKCKACDDLCRVKMWDHVGLRCMVLVFAFDSYMTRGQGT